MASAAQSCAARSTKPRKGPYRRRLPALKRHLLRPEADLLALAGHAIQSKLSTSRPTAWFSQRASGTLTRRSQSGRAKSSVRHAPNHRIGRTDMLFPGGFPFPNCLADVFSIFVCVLWFWLLITVFGDLFRRQDVSGLAKTLWVIVLIVFPYLGIFVYLISQGRGMAERQSQRAQQARDELRQVVGFSVADELEKLERLKSSGAISSEEYASL